MILLVITFALPLLHCGFGQYEDEYREGGEPNNDGNLEHMLVRVTANGEVFPINLNPAARSNLTGDDRLEKIPTKKVVGGKESNPGSVPYIVAFEYSKSLFCAGSIYNSKTIVTASHCFYGNYAKRRQSVLDSIIYIAGEFDHDTVEKTEQKRKAIDVIIHPGYSARESFNDIALVIVDPPFVYNKFVQPIPIDRPPVVPEQVGTAMISGWGYTKKRQSDGGTDKAYVPSKLREANVHVFTKKECNRFYDNYWDLKELIDAGLICAGFESGKVDTCQGDSGGPLACYNPKKKNRRYLCGVVSTGVGCGLPKFPGFYTRVAQFHDWIISHAGYADQRTIDDARTTITQS